VSPRPTGAAISAYDGYLLLGEGAGGRIRIHEANERRGCPVAVAVRRRVAEATDLVVDDQVIVSHVSDPCLVATGGGVAGGVSDRAVGDDV
jgi:hypothetical protein